MVEQYDIFGNCSEVKEPERKPTNKYKTMPELWGYTEGKTCKTCQYLMDCRFHGKQYYKCSLWKISHSSVTDIRLKNKACGKYKVGD